MKKTLIDTLFFLPEKINTIVNILRLQKIVFAGVAKPGQRRKVEGLVL